MCDREAYDKLRNSIAELQKTDAVQSEQIKTLFKSTKAVFGATKLLLGVIVLITVSAVFALIFGALGPTGFNAVTKALPATIATGGTPK